MSDQVTVTLPDGSSREYPSGTTAGEVAASIGEGLAKAALAAKADGEWVDLGQPIVHDAHLEIVVPASDDGREVLRHSTAHVLAQAVTQLFPGAKYAIGPAIADGFYYDFELPNGQTFSESDLERIGNEMRKIVKATSRSCAPSSGTTTRCRPLPTSLTSARSSRRSAPVPPTRTMRARRPPMPRVCRSTAIHAATAPLCSPIFVAVRTCLARESSVRSR